MSGKRTDLYTPDGWVDASRWFLDPATFVICTGGRGIGKTFGALKYILDHEIKFIYLRRTQAQIDTIKLPELNPFRAVNMACGYDIVSQSMGKYVGGFYHSDDEGKPAGPVLGIAVALSVISNLRGFSAEDYELVLFDEFVPERHERPIREEGAAFLNCLETINRNRELQGRDPVKVIMLSNSNDLDSPILSAIGALKPLDDMIRKGRSYQRLYDGAMSIYRYLDSPVSAKKKKTALYRVSHSEDFNRMALDNEFSAANYENVKAMPLNQFRPLVSIGSVTVYEHKSDYMYYIVPGVKSENVYTLLPNSKKAFIQKYAYVIDALYRDAVFYVSAPVKIEFERIWKAK